jgi:hypothetical protein
MMHLTRRGFLTRAAGVVAGLLGGRAVADVLRGQEKFPYWVSGFTQVGPRIVRWSRVGEAGEWPPMDCFDADTFKVRRPEEYTLVQNIVADSDGYLHKATPAPAYLTSTARRLDPPYLTSATAWEIAPGAERYVSRWIGKARFRLPKSWRAIVGGRG